MTLLQPEDYRFFLKNDLATFVERSFLELNPQTRFFSAPHIEIMAAKLEACLHGDIKRLILCVPPRHLKSLTATVAFTAWWLGHNPAGHIIAASYGQELADKLARDCRKVMASTWYQSVFRTRLLSNRQAVHDFSTSAQGTRMATSVGGVLTGRGADLIVIDDPLKADEALSEPRRKAVNEWYDNSLVSRLNDRGAGRIIVVMQRLHQDDLVGHVLEQEPWEVVSFPAMAEQDEAHVVETLAGRYTFRRRAGEALHPERESLQTLMEIRRTMTEYNFAAQFQQRPVPPGGGLVKTEWLSFYDLTDLPERFDVRLHSWDTANKATELSDYSVCTCWGIFKRRFYLLDVYRRRMNYPELREAVIALARRDRPARILIEDKASGISLLQDLRSAGIESVQAYSPPAGADKIMRLHGQTAVFANGHVLLPRQAPWLAEYIAELTGFPGTRHDDQVDATSQALAYVRSDCEQAEIWANFGRQVRESGILDSRPFYPPPLYP